MKSRFKIVKRWMIMLAGGVGVFALAIGSSFSLHNAYAEAEFNIDNISQNAYYKVVYQNLKKCYNELKSPLVESSTNTWAAFDTKNVYFPEAALKNDFLKFPYKTGKKNQSSCSGLITGWKTNWFLDLFPGSNGSYGGLLQVNKNATVPESSWTNSVDKFSKFLQDIGYTRTADSSKYANSKCFYVTMKVTNDFADTYYVPRDSQFDTQDFCVNLDGSGNVSSTFHLKGKNDYFGDPYDEGHLDDEVNVAFVAFDHGGDEWTPEFRVGADTGDTILTTTVDYLFMNYKYYNYAWEDYDRDALLGMTPDSITNKKKATDSDYCWGLGYTQCGWEDAGLFYSTWYWGTIAPVNGTISYDTYKSKLTGVISKLQDDGVYWFDNVTAVDYSPTSYSYTKSSDSKKFMEYFLLNVDKYDDGVFNDAEKYILYYTYLKEYYEVRTRNDAVDGGVKVSWLNDDGETFTELFVYSPKAHEADEQYVLDNNGKWNGQTKLDWYNIALLLQKIDVTTAFDGAEVSAPIVDDELDPDGIYKPEDSDSSTNTSSCAGLNAAGSLSWVICPVLELAAGATQWMYGSIVEPFLAVESGMLNTNSGTYVGWKIFQNMANVLAIVLLLIVIFSQVTGIGIDNYGIKKILPKLIVGIVLINLSFIISQALVDISNIAGSTIKNLFDNLGQDVAIQAIEGESIANNSAFASTAGTVGVGMALAGVLIAFPGIGAAIGTAILPLLPGILLALLGAVLGMLVAVLLLFVLLTVRKIAVIVLVVISPLAFACYMLPNTKKIFDKWANFLKNMLLMYPICGLVIGGGNFVSKVILTSATDSNGNLSFVMALAGMLASIVPFFFVPTLLKGSMNVLGNIGSKLSNFGKNTSGKAKGLVAGTDRMKDMQKRAVMARNQRLFNRYKNLEDSGKKLSDYQKRRMNNARVAYNSAASEDIAAAAGGAMLKEGSTAYDAALAMQKSAVNKQELDNQIAVMADTTDNYDVDKMDAQLQALLSKTSALNHDDELKMKALMKQLTTKGGYGKKKLASALGNASTATRAQAAKFMSKDGDVASAVNKNMMVAQYMREVNNGQVAGNTDFNTWQQSNAQRVLTQVITSDTDFVNQSASAVSSQVDLLSDERLSAIVNNERVMDAADSDVRTAIIAAAKARNMDIPTRYGGVVQDTPQPIATPVQQAPIAGNGDPTTLNVQGGSNATGKPVEVKIEQPTPKLNVEQVVERMDSGSRQRMQTDGGIILNESPEVQRQLEREFRQKKDEADRKNGRNGGGIILPS